MDLITNLPKSAVYHVVFAIVGRFSKYMTLISGTNTSTTLELAKFFNNHIDYKFGMPFNNFYDRDSRFLSHFW